MKTQIAFAMLLMSPIALAEDAPAEDTPAQDAPAQDTPAQETPAEEAPAEATPAEAAPAEAAPAEAAPAEADAEAPPAEAEADDGYVALNMDKVAIKRRSPPSFSYKSGQKYPASCECTVTIYVDERGKPERAESTCDDARYERASTKAGMKLHTVYDPNTEVLVYFEMTHTKVNDSKALSTLPSAHFRNSAYVKPGPVPFHLCGILFSSLDRLET